MFFQKNIDNDYWDEQLDILLLRFYTHKFDREYLYTFWFYFYGFFMTTKLFRVLFSLPVNGQNGWSTIHTLRRYNNYIYAYKFFFFKSHFRKAKKNHFLAEYFNMYFQACFRNQWLYNKKALRYKRFIRKYIDIKLFRHVHGLNMFRSRYAGVLSKKKQKKGPTRNLGLKFGFTKKLRGNLIS